MPIRINLKELFPADPQQITVDKVNFNFNKLLELGIGDRGLRGLAGIQGSAGPIGIQGDVGIRGNAWFVDAVADPNTLTFPDLLPGDFYLDSQSFAVWQYDGTDWQFTFDLSEIINNYLAASPSPFIRGLGIGSPNDDRFILFNKRGNTAGDVLDDRFLGASATGNNANSDILLLNNFNEDYLSTAGSGFDFGPAITPINDQVSTENFFNSLLSIYVDHQDPQATSFGRYHLELGHLYLDGSDRKLSDAVDNLKVKFYRDSSSVHLFSSYYNIAEISLDRPDDASFSRKTNSLFQLRSAKWNGSGIDTQVDTIVGSKFAIDEFVGTSGISKVDGIAFNESLVWGSIGTSFRYDINGGNFPDETGYVTNVSSGINSSYFTLDALGNSTAGILIDSKTLQDGGNLIQLATTSPREIDNAARNSAYVGLDSYIGNVGIAVRGDRAYSISGKPAPPNLTIGPNYGYFNRYGIENPNSPISDFIASNIRFDGTTSAAVAALCDQVFPAPSQQPVGPGASDLKIVGKYAYVVNNQSFNFTASSFSSGSSRTHRTYFQILETEGIAGIGLKRVSRLGQDSYLGSNNVLGPGAGTGGVTNNDPGELTCAYRVEIKGKYAIVARNPLPYSTDFPTIDVNNPNCVGGLAAIDVSDPTSPRIVVNRNDDLTGANGTNSYDTASILDTCLLGDTLFALTFLQDEGSPNVLYEAVIKSYDLSSLTDTTPTITKKGVATASISSGTAGNLSYQLVPRKGAIVANEQHIYAGYGKAVYVYLNSNATKSPSCEQRYPQISSLDLDPTNDYQKWEVLDIEQLGNSLYVLAKAELGGTPKTFVIKADVSGGLGNTRTGFSPVNPPTTIYRKEITDGLGGRFAIVGKHIYVALVNSTNSDAGPLPGLLALDFDGFYTGGAHIESLRSEKVEITKSLSVGDDLTLHGDAEIGGSMSVGGSVSVSGGISAAYGTVPVGAVMPFAGSAAPTGWLLCDGDSVSSTNYLQLHSVISNTYGGTAYAGIASLSFNLPDLRSRIPVGIGQLANADARETETSNYSLGDEGGINKYSLSKGEIPPHVHSVDDADGSTVNITSSGAHTHSHVQGGSDNPTQNTDIWSAGDFANNTRQISSANSAHTHQATSFAGNTANGSQDGLAGNSHENRMPYLALNYIIYAGV
jgi:microcystin-dependent protein